MEYCAIIKLYFLIPSLIIINNVEHLITKAQAALNLDQVLEESKNKKMLNYQPFLIMKINSNKEDSQNKSQVKCYKQQRESWQN